MLPREKEPVKEPWIGAGVNEGTTYKNDKNRGQHLDATAPQAQRNGDRWAQRSPQKGQQEHQQSHGQGKNQECLQPSKEAPDGSGEDCDRSQEGSGSTDAYRHKPSPKQEACPWCEISHRSFPHPAAQTHNWANQGQPVGLTGQVQQGHRHEKQAHPKLYPPKVGGYDSLGATTHDGNDDAQCNHYSYRP